MDTATWKAVPMHLIVDSFSRAPMVLLPGKGFMGLDVSGHGPVFEIPGENEIAGAAMATPLNEIDIAVAFEPVLEASDQTSEDSLN